MITSACVVVVLRRDKLWRRLVSGKWRGNRFYDIWVARDEAGQPFIEDPPVVKHAHGKERREGECRGVRGSGRGVGKSRVCSVVR